MAPPALTYGVPMTFPKQLRICLGAFALTAVLACKLPEQRQAFYPNGAIKERYWVYMDGGREVMNGLYAGFYPNGEKEVEIEYRDGAEVVKTFYNERGIVIGTVNVAAGEDEVAK
jgi:antitoxin component YwqK of YwqJK toxin-antitoxin module